MFACSRWHVLMQFIIWKIILKRLPPTIMKPKCALDRNTILCPYAPGFQRQFFKQFKNFVGTIKGSERTKEDPKSVVVAELAKNSQNAQFGLVMTFWNIGLNVCFVILRLKAWFYDVNHDEQICSQMSICSPCQISLQYDNINKNFQNLFCQGRLKKRRKLENSIKILLKTDEKKIINKRKKL